ncbi:MAB_1171c family putative transporter [Salinispora mooreana]|uniref:MAB_1171c family putative transporter n=1 Tax=Salinispora mooreana TaxID=999545 RepID=UPI000370E703|nr:MAB_1171c family putative transporter [Salinispora mooreana]
MAMLQVVGLGSMWVVAALLLPQAWQDAKRRMLWAVLLLFAIELTLYRPEVQAPIYDVINGHIVFVAVHLVSVGKGIGVLYLLLMLVQRPRYRLPVAVAGVAVSAVMIAIYAAARPEPATVDIPPEIPLIYWHILAVFHTVVHLLAVVLCWRASRLVAPKAMRVSLMALTGGLMLACLPWAFNLGWLLTDDTAWLEPIGPIDAVTGLFLAFSAALPLVASVHRAVRHRRAIRDLEPLWTELTTAVPDIVFAPVRPGLGVRQLRLRLYRRVVELRDAMLTLREHVTPGELRAAQEHVAAEVSDEQRQDAAATACWLAAAVAAKSRGDEPMVQQEDLTSAPGGDLDEEVRQLLEIAQWYRSPLVDRYRAGLPPVTTAQ